MIKNIGKSILFMFILFLLIAGISCLLLPWHAVKKYGIMTTARYDIVSEGEDMIDAIILGDSLVYSSVSPMVIWNNYGYTTFDCAVISQLTRMSYENLKVAIDTQHPKVVFFETLALFRNPYKVLPTTASQWFTNKYIPIINYHDNWKKDLFNFLNNDNKFTKLNVYKGFHLVKKVKPAPKSKYNYMAYSADTWPIVEENAQYFDKIVKLCRENNVKLVLVSLPNIDLWNYRKHNSVENLSEKYKLEFIDFNLNNPLKIDWQVDTKDAGGHLNNKGAIKVSNFIGEYLKSSGLVKDHRKDKKYQSWNDSYLIYKQS